MGNLKAKSPHVSELQKEAKEARHKAAVAKKKADAMPDAAVDAKSKHDLGSSDALKAKSLHVRKLQKEAKEARHKAAAAKKKADAMPTRLAALKEKAVKKKKKLKKDKNKELNSGELGS